MSLLHRRAGGRDVEDPNREPSDLSVSSQIPSVSAVELVMDAQPPPQQILDMPPDQFDMMELRRKYARLPAPKKGLSDWALWFLVTGGIFIIVLLIGLLYMALNPILKDTHELTSMLAAHKPEIEVALKNTLAMLNDTTTDAARRYISIINDATQAMDNVKALVNDPQTQANLRVLTDGISKGDFEKIGRLANVILKVTGAVAQSAGDNGITLRVGNWKAYVNESELNVNN